MTVCQWPFGVLPQRDAETLKSSVGATEYKTLKCRKIPYQLDRYHIRQTIAF